MVTLSQHHATYSYEGESSTALSADSIRQIIQAVTPMLEESVSKAIAKRLQQLREQRAAARADDEPVSAGKTQTDYKGLSKRIDGLFDEQILPRLTAEVQRERAAGKDVSLSGKYAKAKADFLAPKKSATEQCCAEAQRRVQLKRSLGRDANFPDELAAVQSECGADPQPVHYARVKPVVAIEPPKDVRDIAGKRARDKEFALKRQGIIPDLDRLFYEELNALTGRPLPEQYAKQPPPAGTGYIFQSYGDRAVTIGKRRHQAKMRAGLPSVLTQEIRKATNELFEIVAERQSGKISTTGGVTTSRLYKDYDADDLVDLDYGARSLSEQAAKLAQQRTLERRNEGKGASYRDELPKALAALREQKKEELELAFAH